MCYLICRFTHYLYYIILCCKTVNALSMILLLEGVVLCTVGVSGDHERKRALRHRMLMVMTSPRPVSPQQHGAPR